ncbi:MAG: hypothetical protein Kow0029_30420 [Candidatus Rifleibacteriota bacterium]
MRRLYGDKSVVAKGLCKCEEMCVLPVYEEKRPIDLAFMSAQDILRAVIIIFIVYFSIKETAFFTAVSFD